MQPLAFLRDNRVLARVAMTGAAIALAGCAPADETVAPDAEVLASADALAGRFQTELKAQLSAALSEGGPVGAIGVCQSAAPAIAEDLSRESGGVVRRIARKNRNPANALQPGLDELYTALEAAPLVDGAPNAVHTVRDDRLLYLKAIPMQEQPCAVCHGTEIAPEVQAAIASAYPADMATGFQPGELRGAFVIELDLPSAKQ